MYATNRVPRVERRSLSVAIILLLAFVLGSGIAQAAQERPSPPEQPAQGPGGADRTYGGVVASRFGDNPTGYWLFEPADADGEPVRDVLPLVIFFHGFLAVDPDIYGAWIDHIVRGGAVVLYLDYQELSPLDLRPSRYFGQAIEGIESALLEVQKPDRTPVDLENVAAVGHSLGGVLAANYAATAGANGLPVPDVLMPVEPGGCRDCGSLVVDLLFGIPLEDLSLVDPSTLAIVIAGEDDVVVGTEPAETIWSELTSLPLEQRDYVLIRSDDHGNPELRADHFLPMTSMGGSVDALDWYGPWKLLDGLMACAFDGELCERAIGGTSFQEFMGRWSDDTPVTPALVADI